MKLNSKKIYIIGFGAIGKVLAVFLKNQGREVVAVRGSVDDGQTTNQKIEVEFPDGSRLVQSIDVVTLSHIQKFDGFVVLANKSFGNEKLSMTLKNKIGNAPILILQNGMGVESAFSDEVFQHLYRCVLFATSQVIDENLVKYKPVAVSPIGVIRGNEEVLEELVELIHTPDFQFRAEINIQPVIWKKAILNTVFNSICPLLDVDNGIFCRNEKAMELALSLMKTCMEVAKAYGVRLNLTDLKETLINISKNSDGQLISTLQDIKNGRKTEIETLNFEIVEKAKFLNLSVSLDEVLLLGELIRLKEEIGRNRNIK